MPLPGHQPIKREEIKQNRAVFGCKNGGLIAGTCGDWSPTSGEQKRKMLPYGSIFKPGPSGIPERDRGRWGR
jgi:hypothetical protein